ncbi:MAG UNVERIFIED_CONTAM: DUF309 domain-containing protein [Planctomycetaceae bacterium]
MTDCDFLDPRIDEGIRLFNAGDYFECHDVLEDFWSELTCPEKPFFQDSSRPPSPSSTSKNAISPRPAACICPLAQTSPDSPTPSVASTSKISSNNSITASQNSHSPTPPTRSTSNSNPNENHRSPAAVREQNTIHSARQIKTFRYSVSGHVALTG